MTLGCCCVPNWTGGNSPDHREISGKGNVNFAGQIQSLSPTESTRWILTFGAQQHWIAFQAAFPSLNHGELGARKHQQCQTTLLLDCMQSQQTSGCACCEQAVRSNNENILASTAILCDNILWRTDTHLSFRKVHAIAACTTFKHF